MRRRLSGAVLLGAVVLSTTGAAQDVEAQHSALWGEAGEAWQAGGRLPDFSYAGYMRGESPIPQPGVDLNVRDFGATGDGETDDSAAFVRALSEAGGKTLLVPPGRYVITEVLEIGTSGTVLRGAGAQESVLFFPKPLNDIKPNWGATTTGQRTSNYSWSGGFVRVSGSWSKQRLALVNEGARRGESSLALSDCEGIKVGDELRLVLKDTPENTLARHLYAGDPGAVDNLKGHATETFIARVTSVDSSAGRVQLDRALRTDVRAEWNPAVFRATSSVEHVGIENLGFDYPGGPYMGHFTELGFNAISMGGVRHCWIRNVRINDPDSGIFVSGVNITIDGLVITSDRTPEKYRKATGHHGVTLGGQDNLLTAFDIRTRFMHGITMTRGSAGNVVSAGRGLDLALDHHCYGNHSNLFTDIDLGEGSRMLQSGGGAKLGRHSGALETFWCVRGRRSQSWPVGWGPDRMNFVGVRTDVAGVTDLEGRWFEAIPPEALTPRNLHQAQLARRLR